MMAIKEAIDLLPSEKPVLLVGFPRDEYQASIVINSRIPVFLIDTPIDVCMERARTRLADLAANPHAFDVDRGTRDDETPEKVATRFKTFVEVTLPAIMMVEAAGLLHRITGDPEERALKIDEIMSIK